MVSLDAAGNARVDALAGRLDEPGELLREGEVTGGDATTAP